MLRDPSLIPLSHQHQHALSLCVRLARALQAGAVDLGVWQLEVHQHYANEVQFHFAAEEKVLFPAARRFPELAMLVEELAGEHERQLFEAIQQRMRPEELTSLGNELARALEDTVQACRLNPRRGEIKAR
jgi:hemerythrin-like domain-containing protein